MLFLTSSKELKIERVGGGMVRCTVSVNTTFIQGNTYELKHVLNWVKYNL